MQKSTTPENLIGFLDYLSSSDLRFIGIVVTFLGVLGAIGTFIYQQNKSRRNRRKDSRNHWILTIIIQPRLDCLNDFYKKCLDMIKESLEEVERLINSKVSPADQRRSQAALMREIKKEKLSFVNDFISLIDAYDSKKGRELTEIINGLDDIISENVGINVLPSAAIDLIELESEITKNKADFLRGLYSLVGAK